MGTLLVVVCLLLLDAPECEKTSGSSMAEMMVSFPSQAWDFSPLAGLGKIAFEAGRSAAAWKAVFGVGTQIPFTLSQCGVHIRKAQ